MAIQHNSERQYTGGAVPSALPLPQAYQEMLADLSPAEVSALLAIQPYLDGVADDPPEQSCDGLLQRTNFIAL